MNLARLSIQRPIFISSIVILMLVTGFIALSRLGVDLFPSVTFPVVSITTPYPGAGPEEVENLISRPLEDELSGLSGMKRITSRNQEGVSIVIAEFSLETDVKYAEQQVRDRVARAKVNFPLDVDDPLVQRFDPDDQPVLRISLQADLGPAALYDLGFETVKPLLEQSKDVGGVRFLGGTRREIQVELSREKLNEHDLPAVQVAERLNRSGANIPVGKFDQGSKELSFRAIGRFESLKEIENALVNFGADIGSAVEVRQLGKVVDSTEDEKARSFLYAPDTEIKKPGFIRSLIGGDPPEVKRDMRPALFIDVYKQSGSNTVEVVDAALARMAKINEMIAKQPGSPKLILVRDGSIWIRANLEEVAVAILLGIILAVIVVYLFLGNVRSTIITGLALPNSLLGAFLLMYVMDFTINVMTLLSLSLCIGLLVDDAIVVRENIFRKLEAGMSPREAAEKGTNEVSLAVIATTATVIAVFLPVGFLTGIIGQFFKQFGLTVVFAMAISLFDALTIAPMLSAYFAGRMHEKRNIVIRTFDRFQDWLDRIYTATMRVTLNRRLMVLAAMTLVFFLSLASLGLVKKTFLPPNDQGEFQITFEMPPGTSLEGTQAVVQKVVDDLRKLPEINKMAVVIGNQDGESNMGNIGLIMVNAGHRRVSTIDFKDHVRELLGPLKETARARVADFSAVGGGIQYPFMMYLRGEDLKQLDAYTAKLLGPMQKIGDLTDVDSSYRPGKPEFQIRFQNERMRASGVAPGTAGQELRYHVAGGVVGKLHQNGLEYDVRLRLRPDERDLRSAFLKTYVPNLNGRMIPLSAVSNGQEAYGPAFILRQDRSRVVQITANLSANGALQSATDSAIQIIEKEVPLPAGVSYAFVGQSEDFKELISNILLAFAIALVFIYLVLASLYESFITPLTILLAIPTAISGAFFALAITGEMLNIFSMIGVILLMGLVTKNSILLVDRAMENMRSGMERSAAIFEAGQVRLRPILMTTFAMIAGTLPVALGLGEASKSRTAMGVAIIGGLIVSTVVTLVVVPAIFEYIDRFREFVENRIGGGAERAHGHNTQATAQATAQAQAHAQALAAANKKK